MGDLSLGGQGGHFGLFAVSQRFIQNLDHLFHLLAHFMAGKRQDNPFRRETMAFKGVVQQPNGFGGEANMRGESNGEAASIPFNACDADLFTAKADTQDGQRLPDGPRWIAKSIF
ncbi:hypothetical protein CTKA_02621 [Chthonomonas calidirosea]|uniref:Uncharacterized protein n=1 Tax=Chthonomonas calidirosea (strain DSM 23976 / ICMP 18418 / T49) TaxID=1303518 RepID=S0EUC8_CHTCT|nr:hypothetical protein [Chthonomonas calidirosea]CCW35294.1 hypothetical protein CCALI_01478 [Chthonomonas calidirosea T49]CEK20684.1 hypothetical protein CTKA_02621 [Chthonomonas calidirosea]